MRHCYDPGHSRGFTVAMYIQFVKYTPEGAKGLLETGMVAREATMREVVASTGGTMHGFWAVEGGRWHVAALADFPEGVAVQGVMQAYAAGAWADHEVLRVASPSDFDAAGSYDYPPPGVT